MYKKVDTSMNFLDREKEVLEFWKKNDVFEESLEKTKDGEEFTKYAIDIVNKAREMHAYFYLNHQLPQVQLLFLI